MLNHDATDLIRLFNGLFARRYRCRLVRGGDEPLYLPAQDANGYHQLQFAHSYFASALHEIAHWCIAGARRRQQVDFGYWYQPRRDAQQQAEFETMETAPQALEWIFSDAAGFNYRPSVDNLELRPDPSAFLDQVAEAKTRWLTNGLPARAIEFRRALAGYYGD